jgi:uncharacterized membrane protein
MHHCRSNDIHHNVTQNNEILRKDTQRNSKEIWHSVRLSMLAQRVIVPSVVLWVLQFNPVGIFALNVVMLKIIMLNIDFLLG